ncbi:MAG: LysR family transcriptional regulator [Anaerovoracaceae bacterium]|jgi:DNA-binding transcriptional LysR family regulator
MTRSEIEAFLAVAETGSLTCGAKELFISQPAMTHRIKKLEEEIGQQLFIRKKGIRNIELTEAGKRFIDIARKWDKLWEETRDIGNARSLEFFSVTALHSINVFIMPEVYRHFLTRGLTVPLSINTVLHSYEAYPMIENGDTDMAFIAIPMYSRNIDNIPIFKERMRMVYYAEKQFPSRVHPSTLDDKEEIMVGWSNEFKTWHEYWFGPFPRQKVFLDNISLLENLVSTFKGWAIVPASMAENMKRNPSIKICDIEEGPPDRVYYLISRHTDKHKDIRETFIYDLEFCLRDSKVVELL